MNITIPDWAWPSFWDDHGDAEEFWSTGRWKVRASIGDTIYFRYQGRIVATAIVSKISKPGEYECGHSGKFGNGWKVHWEPTSFKDLRPLMYDVMAQAALNRESRTKKEPVHA